MPEAPPQFSLPHIPFQIRGFTPSCSSVDILAHVGAFQVIISVILAKAVGGQKIAAFTVWSHVGVDKLLFKPLCITKGQDEVEVDCYIAGDSFVSSFLNQFINIY